MNPPITSPLSTGHTLPNGKTGYSLSEWCLPNPPRTSGYRYSETSFKADQEEDQQDFLIAWRRGDFELWGRSDSLMRDKKIPVDLWCYYRFDFNSDCASPNSDAPEGVATLFAIKICPLPPPSADKRPSIERVLKRKFALKEAEKILSSATDCSSSANAADANNPSVDACGGDNANVRAAYEFFGYGPGSDDQKTSAEGKSRGEKNQASTENEKELKGDFKVFLEDFKKSSPQSRWPNRNERREWCKQKGIANADAWCTALVEGNVNASHRPKTGKKEAAN